VKCSVRMAEALVVPLEAIRTDGWFERIGEGIGSFQALCDIIGARFFAFAMITGARITSLTVDRRTPDNTLVEFVVGGEEGEVDPSDVQKLTLGEFRLRLVNALVTEEPLGTAPTRATDIEAVQLHIGVRYLLLAPLYGYALRELTVDEDGSRIQLLHDGIEELYPLGAFRARMRTHVREELERVQRPQSRSAIDLSRIADAERAFEEADYIRVLELLGAWPAPLAIFLRTAEGQSLPPDTRSMIARALGLLGSACVALGEVAKGEEVLRLGVQYAGDSDAASDVYYRLGEAMLSDGRPGEALGPLRRAVNLGAPGERVWPLLAQALAQRGRLLAAYSAVKEAEAAGSSADELEAVMAIVEANLGAELAALRKVVEKAPA
jgi:tetratricopeptide (TPR) repeat protein